VRIAVLGGTGLIGSATAARLASLGQEVIAVGRSRRPSERFVKADISDEAALATAIVGCEAVIDCVGINREIGAQTYRRVHVDGTRTAVAAARRPGCTGSSS
jgi:NADH dehydrogenase